MQLPTLGQSGSWQRLAVEPNGDPLGNDSSWLADGEEDVAGTNKCLGSIRRTTDVYVDVRDRIC